MQKRTSKTKIFLRFFAVTFTPFGLFACFLGYPEAALGPAIAVCLYWFIAQFVANTSVRIMAPDEYYALKKDGGNHYYDALGPPWNFDSEETRIGNASAYLPVQQTYEYEQNQFEEEEYYDNASHEQAWDEQEIINSDDDDDIELSF